MVIKFNKIELDHSKNYTLLIIYVTYVYCYSKMTNDSIKHDTFENRQYFKRPKINKQDNLVCKYAHAYKNIYLRVKSGWQDRYVCCIK